MGAWTRGPGRCSRRCTGRFLGGEAPANGRSRAVRCRKPKVASKPMEAEIPPEAPTRAPASRGSSRRSRRCRARGRPAEGASSQRGFRQGPEGGGEPRPRRRRGGRTPREGRFPRCRGARPRPGRLGRSPSRGGWPPSRRERRATPRRVTTQVADEDPRCRRPARGRSRMAAGPGGGSGRGAAVTSACSRRLRRAASAPPRDGRDPNMRTRWTIPGGESRTRFVEG